jgi:hypothetical protein
MATLKMRMQDLRLEAVKLDNVATSYTPRSFVSCGMLRTFHR